MSSGFVLFLFHDKRHLGEMGAAEVEAFLTHLADEEWVAAATLIQALSALLFLSRKKGRPGPNFHQQLLRLTRGDCLRLSRSAARSDFMALPGGFCDAVNKARIHRCLMSLAPYFSFPRRQISPPINAEKNSSVARRRLH
jgi:hypothetical protein